MAEGTDSTFSDIFWRDSGTIYEVCACGRKGLTREVGEHAPSENISKLIPLKWLKTLLNFTNHSENKNSDCINRKKHNSKYYRNLVTQNIGYTVVIAFATNKLELITSVRLSLSVDPPLVYDCMWITVKF